MKQNYLFSNQGHSYRDTANVELERPPASYESLRNRATDAKNKMHLHKTMLDRYLPISFGPENAVEYEVEYKFDELAQRMPSLDPRRPTRYYRGSSLPPSSRSSIVNKNSMVSLFIFIFISFRESSMKIILTINTWGKNYLENANLLFWTNPK